MAARIIDVERKPQRCPKCGERVVDIIYGTGDMTESEFLIEYRKSAIMGGDNIPRNPPVWACPCGCRRFRKVNPDGTVAPVRVKMLRNVRKAPMTLINWQSGAVSQALECGDRSMIRSYLVHVTTNLGEEETLRITAVSEDDARKTAEEIVYRGFGQRGRYCAAVKVVPAED